MTKTYIVEHLDPELEQWSALEYKAIARECADSGAQFVLSSVPPTTPIPPSLAQIPSCRVESRDVETLYKETKDRVCLLDPAAKDELSPSDGNDFDVFLFGGILGDDPPRDRTSELRKKGFTGRRLGPIQMTTDTAVRTTRTVIQESKRLEDIEYIDYPEIRVDAHESSEMPFRYIKGPDGKPIMPEGMIELIKKDAEKGFGELL